MTMIINKLIWQWNSRTRRYLLYTAIIVLTFLLYSQNIQDEEYNSFSLAANSNNKIISNTSETDKYLVWSSKCQISNIDIYTPEVMKLVKPQNPLSCQKDKYLTFIDRRMNDTVLHVAQSNAYEKKFSCCYSIVTRSQNKSDPDNKPSILSSCEELSNSVVLNSSIEFIITKCKNEKKKKIYSNGYAVIHRKPEVIKRSAKLKSNPSIEPLSVVILGIDSVSRLNLHRMMPKTTEYLKTRGWIELKGYNKIGENTYPNLMGILTGFNNHVSRSVCNPTKLNLLDKCPILWYKFRELGYATAYAEDEPKINTFNYQKVGFANQPTDHYFRPYALAIEKELENRMLNNMNYCLGPVTAGERIMDYAYNFIKAYENDTYFGLFWLNSFSHQNLNTPSMMDSKIKKSLDQLETTNVFNKSMVIFLSDHGLRFGKILETESGWFEERLPFIQIWLPEWFIDKYPQALHNLKVNTNRLTTPYDLHMTLQDVLIKSGLTNSSKPSDACPLCTSLFEEIEFNRSCEDAAISSHFCSCRTQVSNVDRSDKKIAASAEKIVKKMNNLLQVLGNQSVNPCEELKLKNITDVRASVLSNIKKSDATLYTILIETVPGFGRFEASVQFKDSNKTIDVKDDISRINRYDNQSYCIDNDSLKKFCYCRYF